MLPRSPRIPWLIWSPPWEPLFFFSKKPISKLLNLNNGWCFCICRKLWKSWNFSDASFPGISDIEFRGRTLKELCKKTEWPTISVILENACRIERASSAELSLSLNGLSILAKVTTLSSLSIDEPIQIYCEILKFATFCFNVSYFYFCRVCADPPHPIPSIARTVSLMEPQPSTSGVDLNENRTVNYFSRHL